MIKHQEDNEVEIEMLCPKCKSDMKEYVTKYKCRGCKLEVVKYFKIK